MVVHLVLVPAEAHAEAEAAAREVLQRCHCLLYTSDAADERSSVDLGGRRIIKKKNTRNQLETSHNTQSRQARAIGLTSRS